MRGSDSARTAYHPGRGSGGTLMILKDTSPLCLRDRERSYSGTSAGAERDAPHGCREAA